MKNKDFLQYLIDYKADVLYFSIGKPSKEDVSEEISDGIIGRFNSKTKKLKGFTILNFSKRDQTELPISADFSLIR